MKKLLKKVVACQVPDVSQSNINSLAEVSPVDNSIGKSQISINIDIIDAVKSEIIDFITHKMTTKYSSYELAVALQQIHLLFLLKKCEEENRSSKLSLLVKEIAELLGIS